MSDSDFKWAGGSLKAVMDALREGAAKALSAGGIHVQQSIKGVLGSSGASNIMNGGVGAPDGQPPRVDTGALRRSIQVDVSHARDAYNPKVRVGTNLPYARIQEYGGQVRARGGALPVPIPGHEATAKRLRRQAGPTLRNLKNLAVIKRHGKPSLLVLVRPGKRKGGLSWEPVFVLLKSVTIKPHPYMRRGWAQAKRKLPRVMIEQFEKSIRRLAPPGKAA